MVLLFIAGLLLGILPSFQRESTVRRDRKIDASVWPGQVQADWEMVLPFERNSKTESIELVF